MKKINFNDRYGLTQAVLEGRKTMTRRNEFHDSEQRILNIEGVSRVLDNIGITAMHHGQIQMMIPFRYKVGEIVAVAQRYQDIFDYSNCVNPYAWEDDDEPSGWTNKMFTKAELMPHRIRITGVRCERLQDISDEDCLKEGINASNSHEIGYGIPWVYEFAGSKMVYYTPRAAFASLIDKVSGKGTWQKNPWVWVYEFELVK